MSNLVVQQTNALAKQLGISGDDAELLSVLKATAFKGPATDSQLTALLVVANQYGLNPWTKEVYAFPDKNNGIVPVVGVDGWSRIINTHPQMDGMDFAQDDESCTCTIYRKDRSHPIKVTEWLAECRRPNVGPWQSHPKRMLRHKAMIQCARLAFGYVGIYDQDEAERIVSADYKVVSESPPPDPITEDQAAELADLIRSTSTVAVDFLRWLNAGVDSICALPAVHFRRAKAALEAKAAKIAKEATNGLAA